MKTAILPTKSQFMDLRSASDRLQHVCKGKCDICFMNERLDGESFCPIAHLKSITDNMMDEFIDLALEALPK